MRAKIENKKLCVIAETKDEIKQLRKFTKRNKGKMVLQPLHKDEYDYFVFNEIKLVILI